MTSYPLLPLRDIVVFPGMIAPLFVGRAKSISALEEAVKRDKRVVLVTQIDSSLDEPNIKDLYKTATLASILQILRLPDGTVKVLVKGRSRVKIIDVTAELPCPMVNISLFEKTATQESEVEPLLHSVTNQFSRYAKLNNKVSAEVITALTRLKNPSRLADSIAAHLKIEQSKKQELLEQQNVLKRLEAVFAHMESEIEVLQAEKKIRSRVKNQMEHSQKEYYLNEQLKAIHKELGDTSEDKKDELSLLAERLEKTKMSKEAEAKGKEELRKLRNMPPMSAEATVARNYLDYLLDIPWRKRSRIRHDLVSAQGILDRDHYGLEKIKERIIEYLAVNQRTKKVRGPILCLVGPPGVGKTSLAKSVAEAVGRKFSKIALGGVRDEAEIRGHRRTYIGAMPGKIVQSMKKVGVVNPILLLDEIDKMTSDFRGDPASALLEVLDSEQNENFNDHYLEVDYDLSNVMFIATANSLDIPYALKDRLEIIRIAGYTEEEKIEITKRHLLKKLTKDHGLKQKEWSVTDEAIRQLIHYYTREAGVRSLERELANLARKSVHKILTNEKTNQINITDKNIEKYAGIPRYSFGETDEKDLVGVVNGLAYTQSGGDILTIEAVQLPGKGVVKSTGKLGDVMQESAQAAFSYARSRATDYGIIPPQYQKRDIHIHVPEGATPKDGPSAGVAMFTAITSVMTSIPVKSSVAMTGEITLRGRVLPIGGLKEKLLSALRGGVKTVCIPQENKKDLADIPDNVKQKLKLVFVSHVDEVLDIALTKKTQHIEWIEPEELSNYDQKQENNGVVTH